MKLEKYTIDVTKKESDVSDAEAVIVLFIFGLIIWAIVYSIKKHKQK